MFKLNYGRWVRSGQVFLALVVSVSGLVAVELPYPRSEVILGIELDWTTHQRYAPGSDNFQLTWAADDNLYGAWGDGGGFGGTNNGGRAGLGVARIEGDGDDYRGYNVWGGFEAENPATFDGKSWGMIALENDLYMWVVPDKTPGKDYRNHYAYSEIAHSSDSGATWEKLDWQFTSFEGITAPTFLNFGKGNEGVPDEYGNFVYSYLIKPQEPDIEQQGPNSIGLIVHKPGEIYLARVPTKLFPPAKEDFEFFAGLDSDGSPTWGTLEEKAPVFEDENGVGWCVSAAYHPGLKRVILQTEHGTSHKGTLGFFDAPTPWGPWSTVEYYETGAAFGEKRLGSDLAWRQNIFYASFPTKWFEGDAFTMSFTGGGRGHDNDSFNTIEGRFVLPVPERVTWEPRFQSPAAESWDDIGGILERIVAPDFPERDFDIRDFGASEDGDAATVGAAIQKAIDACSVEGGGRVLVPEGSWPTYALRLKSGVNLHVAKGASLVFDPDRSQYPLVHTSWEGTELMNHSPLIYAYEQENIAVTGEGTLDGSASWETWWDSVNRPKGKPFKQTEFRSELMAMGEENVPVPERVFGVGKQLRPTFIEPNRCKNILIEGVTIVRAPFWVIHPVQSENITIRGVTIDSHGPNNDGIDPESSRDILIEGCTFNTGDDCIAIKAGRNTDGRRINLPSENIVVRDCRFMDGHGALTIGSEITGGCQNVFLYDCVMDSPVLFSALRVKNNARRGGVVRSVFLRDIYVKQALRAVVEVEFDYEEGANGGFSPSLSKVRVEDVFCRTTPSVLSLVGFEGAVLEDIVVSDSTFLEVGHPDKLRNASVDYRNVTIERSEKARIIMPWEKKAE